LLQVFDPLQELSNDRVAELPSDRQVPNDLHAALEPSGESAADCAKGDAALALSVYAGPGDARPEHTDAVAPAAGGNPGDDRMVGAVQSVRPLLELAWVKRARVATAHLDLLSIRLVDDASIAEFLVRPK
jgi:hypothetical protein